MEFKVALIFAVLFVIFTIVTHYTLIYTGTGGLNVLSFIAGLSDITPFILNLLQGSGVAVVVVTACCMQAIVSNIAINSARTLTNILSNPFSLCFFNSENLVGKEKEPTFAAFM